MENKNTGRLTPEFRNLMTDRERFCSLVYLPIHFFILPMTLGFLLYLYPFTSTQINLIYYALGLFFVLIFMLKFLRANFDVALDNALMTFWAISMGFTLNFLLAVILQFLSSAVGLDLSSTPNNEAVVYLTTEDFNMTYAMVVYMSPMVEEVLFRGLLFGVVYEKFGKKRAYLISILVFSLLHTWQFILIDGDLSYLIYTLNYIPGSFALAYCYEKCANIWGPIGLHMFINWMSMQALMLL